MTTNITPLLWGIDLGGSKVEVAVMQADSKVLYRQRLPTEQHLGYEHILAQIGRLITDASQHLGVRPERIGAGIPGTIDHSSNRIKNANTQALNGKTFKQDLSEQLNAEVVVANDANCFALAETQAGIVTAHHADAEIVVGLILGTGVGAGLVVHGKILNGLHGIAGEWGHNPLPGNNSACYCGRTGCIETLLSGSALEAAYRQQTQTRLSAAVVAARAEQGDTDCLACLYNWLDHFGRAVAQLINVLDPDVIVVGGGLGNMAIIYEEGPSYIAKHVFNDCLKTALLKPKLGDSAGVIGAAMLVK